MSRIATVTALLLTLSATAHAGAPPAAVGGAPQEIWIEASTAHMLLPASLGGRVSVLTCPTCTAVMLQVTAESVFRIDQRVVSLDDWRVFVAKGGPYEADVAYRARDSVLLGATVNSAAKLSDPNR